MCFHPLYVFYVYGSPVWTHSIVSWIKLQVSSTCVCLLTIIYSPYNGHRTFHETTTVQCWPEPYHNCFVHTFKILLCICFFIILPYVYTYYIAFVLFILRYTLIVLCAHLLIYFVYTFIKLYCACIMCYLLYMLTIFYWVNIIIVSLMHLILSCAIFGFMFLLCW